MALKKKKLRALVEDRLDDLAGQTEDLRKQVADRAPGVRDQVLAAMPDKDQIRSAIPDKDRLLDLRDDLFDRLPESVSDRLPEKVKPKRSRLKKIALLGAVTGVGAAAFVAVKNQSKGTAPMPAEPFPTPSRPAPAAPAPSRPTPAAPAPAPTDVVDPA